MGDGPRVGLFLATFFAAGGVTLGYLSLWFASRGLSGSQIGDILGLSALIRMVAIPALGVLADRVGRRRMLFVASVLATGAALGLPLAEGFAAILIVAMVHGVSASVLTPLAEAKTLALSVANRLNYPRTRAAGSVAFIVGTSGGGVLVGTFGPSVVPYLLAVAFGLAAALVPALPRVTDHAPARPHAGDTRLLHRPAFRLTLVASALIQGAHAAQYGFATLYWQAAGLSDALIGVLWAEGVAAEIALFWFGRRLAERIGPARLTACAAAASVVRWGLMAATLDVAVLVPLQLLHAATFAMQHLSTMQVVGRTVPASRAATAQALVSALGFAAPTGLMSWLAGALYERDPRPAFATMALFGGCALLVVMPLRRALDRQDKGGGARRSPTPPAAVPAGLGRHAPAGFGTEPRA